MSDDGESSLLRYIADSKAEDNRLAAAQNAADQLETSLSDILAAVVQKYLLDQARTSGEMEDDSVRALLDLMRPHWHLQKRARSRSPDFARCC